MDSDTMLFSAGGGVVAVIFYICIQLCVKHKIHTKFISACCQTEIDIDANSPKYEKIIEK
jgi:hypothetical protein